MGERILIESRKFRVQRRSVRDRDGQEREYDMVAHPGAAVILPLLDDGAIVLIRNYRFTVDEALLELPAGTLDPPETPETCAHRELAEETGYRAAWVKPLIRFYSTPGICDETMHVFVAGGLTPGEAEHEPGERIEPVRMTLEQAVEEIRVGRIQDAKTIVALLFYERFQHGKQN